MTVALHIEIKELVLHGFAPGDRDAIAMAVQAELTRLLTAQGLPSHLARGADLPRLDAGSFAVAPGARPQALGGQIARSVLGGLRR